MHRTSSNIASDNTEKNRFEINKMNVEIKHRPVSLQLLRALRTARVSRWIRNTISIEIKSTRFHFFVGFSVCVVSIQRFVHCVRENKLIMIYLHRYHSCAGRVVVVCSCCSIRRSDMEQYGTIVSDVWRGLHCMNVMEVRLCASETINKYIHIHVDGN